MKRARLGVIQGQLFGSRSAAERFRVDETTGVVTRIVTLRDPDAEPVVTSVGAWDRNVSLDDIRAVADLSYLQSGTSPAVEDGPEVRVADLFSGCGAMS